MRSSFKILAKIIGASIFYYVVILVGAYMFYQKYPLDGKFIGLFDAIEITRNLMDIFIFVFTMVLIISIYYPIRGEKKNGTIGYLFSSVYLLFLLVIFNFF